jgi:hypothetical protein
MSRRRRAAARTVLLLVLPLLLAAAPGGRAPRTWEAVARLHFARYPAMAAADLYKLVAQGVSGTRHLLADPDASRRYLEQELAETAPADGPLCEPIAPGGAVLRVHLAPFKARGLASDALFAALRESAQEIDGGGREFAAVWRRLVRLAGRGRIPVAPAELRRLAATPFDPLAWTHHSDAFERLYRPHYRVASRAALCRHFPELAAEF